MPSLPPSLEDARQMLALLARPGDVHELRGLVRVNGQPHVTSGYFDDVDALARAAIHQSGKDTGVYVTLNPVDPACLARKPKNKATRAGSGDTTSDRDVQRRRSLLIDVDPVRPAGVSSTDAEHEAAIALARRIRDDLAVAGWSPPMLADSGNGAHLIYAIDLPVDDGKLVMRVLAALSKRYSTQQLKIDEKVFNPARISKVYGTLTKKGEDTDDRPWRLARLIEYPAALVEVTREQLEALAPVSPGMRAPTAKVDHYTVERAAFDLDTWLAEHLPDARERPWAEGRRWIVPVCPFEPQHDRGEAYVCQLASGAVSAGCLHESCRWSWQDLRASMEPAYAERRARPLAHGSTGNGRVSHREPPPEVIYEDADYRSDVDAAADRDREVPSEPPPTTPAPPVWKRAPALVDEILSRANDPWIELKLGPESLGRVRAGGTVVVIGGSGSGKSSLVSCMLVQHAKEVGPAIAMSIELPADELAARIVGTRCDSSWEDVLRGKLPRHHMADALDLPRLFVLERRHATVANLAKVVSAAREEYPDQPILVAVDYAQLIESRERDARMRVADAFAQIDDSARDHRFVALAVSQMSRASAKKARQGEALGAESADLGAETASIERFATMTLTIGMSAQREDGTSSVELSIGKGRMSQGDRVRLADFDGRTGRWRLTDEVKTAAEVRDARETERATKDRVTAELAMLASARASHEPLVRAQLVDSISGRKAVKQLAVKALLARGDLIEVNRRLKGSRSWLVWTPDRAADAGVEARRERHDQGAD